MSAVTLTPADLDYIASEMSEEFPHLSITVELRDGGLYVRALPQIETTQGTPATT